MPRPFRSSMSEKHFSSSCNTVVDSVWLSESMIDDGDEKVAFFFDPDYDTLMKINSIKEGNWIKLAGYTNKSGFFTVKKILDDGAEVF